MKHIAQRHPGEWWISEDGRNWDRLTGPAVAQIAMGFDLIQGAMEIIAEPSDGVFNIQMQFSRKSAGSGPTASKNFLESPKTPIAEDEIRAFYTNLGSVFKEPPNKNGLS